MIWLGGKHVFTNNEVKMELDLLDYDLLYALVGGRKESMKRSLEKASLPEDKSYYKRRMEQYSNIELKLIEKILNLS